MRKYTVSKQTKTAPKVESGKEMTAISAKEWKIITAIECVYRQAAGSGLSEDFWDKVALPLEFLKEKLQLTDVQIVVLALLAEAGESQSWKQLADTLGCNRLTMMAFHNEIEDLIQKRWIMRCTTRSLRATQTGFVLEQGVIAAMQRNEVFVPEQIDGLTDQQLVDKIVKRLDRKLRGPFVLFTNEEEWMMRLVSANPNLPLCSKVLSFHDIHMASLLLLVVYNYSVSATNCDEGLSISTLERLYPDEIEFDYMRDELMDGSHPLIRDGLIEHKCVDGIADTTTYVLTADAKAKLLAAYTPTKSSALNFNGLGMNLKHFGLIKEKQMFYNSNEENLLTQLTDILSMQNFPSVQQRLDEAGMRRGFACLFYGTPGTGKTESVYQIARKTGRDILQVDITSIRDKYVGETEKHIAAVFARYRQLCNSSEAAPILLFNEADAILGKRTSVGRNPAVEKMENAMQNILLQEMENLEGILIATTNLTENLDNAFERRFLFKVKFNNPETDAMVKIWCALVKGISSGDARLLASKYHFSGGQIENIARKVTIDCMLYGKDISLEGIENHCRNEAIYSKHSGKPIGFRW